MNLVRKNLDPGESRDDAIARSDRLIAAGIVVALFIIYFATRLRVHNQCVDCASYAARLQRGELGSLFQGGHLIYLWVLSNVSQLLESLLPVVDPITSAQVFNSLLAGLAVGVFYLFGRWLQWERWLCIALSIALASSYSFWLFTVDVEVHAPAVFLCMLALYVAARLPAGASAWKTVALGVLTGLAILFHVFSGLMALIVIALLLLQRVDPVVNVTQARLEKLKLVLIYSTTTAICVIVPYLYVTTRVLELRTASDIFSWIFAFRGDTGYSTIAALPLGSILAAWGTGIVRALLGVYAWVATPGLGEMLLQQLSEKCTAEELYLVRDLSPALATVITASGATAGALLIVVSIMSASSLAKELRCFSRVAIALVMWLVLYAAMIMYLAPGTYEHMAFYWFPVFFIALGLGLSKRFEFDRNRRRLVRQLVIGLAISLFIANSISILLQTSANNDVYLHRLGWYQANTTDRDMLITAGGYKWTGYTDYFLSARIEPLDERFKSTDYPEFWEEMQAEILLIQSKGGQVYVTQDALQPEVCQARYGRWDLAQYSAFRRDMMPRIDCFQHEGISICEVVS